MPLCGWCGEPVKREWAERLSETDAARSSGPVYFCGEDHKEDYEHYRDPEDGFSIATLNEDPWDTNDRAEYGEWIDEGTDQ